MDTPLIQMQDVAFKAGNADFIKDLNLDIPEKKFTVIMGTSGSGKSTLLKLAAGLLVPHTGKVFFQGESWDDLGEHRTIEVRSQTGFVFQNAALWANKSLYQNIELPLTFHRPGISKDEVRERIVHLCGLVQYKEDMNQRPAQLSLGEQKLISFLRAYCLDPEVLFLDDPTASLDTLAKDRILTVLDEFKHRNKSALMVTQDPTVTARLADHLVILKGGKVLEQGTFSQVTKSKNPEVTEILTSVLSQASTYDTDILDLLSGGPS